jgi:histidinol phosphatase-like enzyme
MLEFSAYEASNYDYSTVDKSQMLMIGDASGLEGNFSDSDLKTAENFGIDYMDVSEFISRYAPVKI